MLNKQISIKHLHTLSPAQENILYYMLQAADNKSYFEQLVFDIHAELDAQLIHESWQILTNHYDVLRTIFVHKDLQPLQTTLKHVDVEFYFNDIQRLTAQEQFDYLHTFKQQDRTQGFNLYQDILSRISLFQLDNQRFIMIWTYHAILLDNQSSKKIQQALLTTYQALKSNALVQLPTIIPYHHYTAWLNKQAQQHSQQYWQHYLHNYQNVSGIPEDNNKSTISVAQYTTQLSIETSQKLFEFAQQKATSINTVLQAVWGYLLCYYNDSQDVVLGTNSNLNSTQFDVESIVGLLSNIVPIRVKIDKMTCFEQLLQQVQQDYQAHQAHCYHAFAEIQQYLQHPIIDHVLCFEQPTKIETDIAIEIIENFKYSGFKLLLSITPFAEYSQIQFFYHENVYTHQQIQRVAQHFIQTIHTIIQQPNISLTAINPLSASEVQQLLFTFNPQYKNQVINYSLVDLFHVQVQQYADKVALIYDKQSLTYAELNQKANQIAHYLIKQGIGADDCVAIFMENGLRCCIALWGILKAGAAYQIVHSTQKPIHAKMILTNIDNILTTTQLLHDPDVQILASDLAYVTECADNIVKIEQDNLIAFCDNLTQTFHWHHSDVVYSTALNSEMAALSLVGGMICGVTVVLPCQQPIEQSLQQHQVSILQTSPQALQTLVTTKGLTPLHNLSIIMLNGEALAPALYAQLQRLENLLVFDLEENPETTLATYVQCLQSGTEVTKFILNNEAAYIISKHGKLLPIGAVGEICIAGAGVGRGYGDEELTQQKFIEVDFLSQLADARLYKTGYLGRRLGNGHIERLGKI